MVSYPIGIPFASYNTDLIILFIGFLFLELLYKIGKGNNIGSGIFFHRNSELEKLLWFFAIGFLVYVLLIPFMIGVMYLASAFSPNLSISFFLIKPTIFSYFFNLNSLFSNFSYLTTPALVALLLIFASIPSILLYLEDSLKVKSTFMKAFCFFVLLYLIFFVLTAALAISKSILSVPLIIILMLVLLLLKNLFKKKYSKNKLIEVISNTKIFIERKYNIDTLIKIIILSVILIVFIFSYNSIFTPTFMVSNSALLTSGTYYVVSGNLQPVIINQSTDQNLTVYNETVERINISSYSNFAYLIVKNNTTDISGQNLKKYTHSYYLPGTLYLPNYPCGSNPPVVCKEENLTVNSSIIKYLLVSDIKNHSATIYVPLEFGPLNPEKIKTIVNVSKPTQSCKNKICEINFSISAKKTVVVNSLSIPIGSTYNLDSVNETINSKRTDCYPITNQIFCNTANNTATTFVVQAYKSLNEKVLSIGIISMPKNFKANITILLNETT